MLFWFLVGAVVGVVLERETGWYSKYVRPGILAAIQWVRDWLKERKTTSEAKPADEDNQQ